MMISVAEGFSSDLIFSDAIVNGRNGRSDAEKNEPKQNELH